MGYTSNLLASSKYIATENSYCNVFFFTLCLLHIEKATDIAMFFLLFFFFFDNCKILKLLFCQRKTITN